MNGHALVQFNGLTEKVKSTSTLLKMHGEVDETMLDFLNFLSWIQSELNDDDFSVEDEGVDRYGLADKVNLYFKIGNFAKFFTEEI